MLNLEVKREGETLREIEVQNNNFLLIQNGTHTQAPDVDAENFRYLRIDEKHIIKQDYQDIAQQLKDKYDRYLGTVWVDHICFIVDEAWEPSKKSNKNSGEKIKICKANKLFAGLTGYDYIIHMKQHYLEKWTEAQVAAAIMSQLLRINGDEGVIYKYTEDFNSKLIATFGIGYLEPTTVIPNMLTEDVKIRGFKEASGQISMDEMANGESEV